ncbi:unnamed protein product, partial [Effrenium voratum]
GRRSSRPWPKRKKLAAFAADETMMRCPCGYMEVRADKPVLCWCQLCRQGECQVCNQLLPEGASAEDLDVQLRPHVVGRAGLQEAKRLV